jgi:hypothetical protein
MAPAPPHDCWSSSEGAVSRGSSRPSKTPGFVWEQRSRPARLLIVRRGASRTGTRALALGRERAPAARRCVRVVAVAAARTRALRLGISGRAAHPILDSCLYGAAGRRGSPTAGAEVVRGDGPSRLSSRSRLRLVAIVARGRERSLVVAGARRADMPFGRCMTVRVALLSRHGRAWKVVDVG